MKSTVLTMKYLKGKECEFLATMEQEQETGTPRPTYHP